MNPKEYTDMVGVFHVIYRVTLSCHTSDYEGSMMIKEIYYVVRDMVNIPTNYDISLCWCGCKNVNYSVVRHKEIDPSLRKFKEKRYKYNPTPLAC